MSEKREETTPCPSRRSTSSRDGRLSRVSNAVQHGLINALGIPPHETPGENISFGRGLAQRAHLSDREKVAS
jgi:hypothetical protein